MSAPACTPDAGSVTPELLARVSLALAAGRVRQQGVEASLRAAFPGIHFSLCADNDIPSRLAPLLLGEGFALYGVATGAHCAALTAQLEAASGIAVALIEAD